MENPSQQSQECKIQDQMLAGGLRRTLEEGLVVIPRRLLVFVKAETAIICSL